MEGLETEPHDEGAIDTASIVSIACSAYPALVVSGCFWTEASAARVSPSVAAPSVLGMVVVACAAA